MAHDVFISYCSRNKPVADAICAGLEAEKLRCWIAPRDVLPGQNYGESIVHAIAGCQVMVLVFSEATNVSQAVIREAERAMHNSKPIIPFRIEDTPMSPGLEFFLASCHWLDAIHPPMDTHIAHLARSVKGLLGQSAYTPEKPVAGPARAKADRKAAVIAAVVALAAMGGFLAWKSIKSTSPPPKEITTNTTSQITLTASLAGAGNGAIASHFSSGNNPRYQASETDGLLTLDLTAAPVPGKITVVSAASAENWLAIPNVDLDLKLLNTGATTAFFQRAVLEVSSSKPETRPVWLADGSRLPSMLSLRRFGAEDDSVPSVSLGIAGPEDSIDLSRLPTPAIMKKGGNGGFEFPLPRAPRPGIEETLFGQVGEIPFEIPLAASPASKLPPAAKDPEPLYLIDLRESGENYTVSCDLSQYVQAGEGDRFFLRLQSPAIARHRFTLKLEYDDGSGQTRVLQGPSVDAGLYPVK